MLLRIEQGKGQKDRMRCCPASCSSGCAPGGVTPGPRARCCPAAICSRVSDPVDSMSTRQLNRAVHEAAVAARIDKRVTMHYPASRVRHASARTGTRTSAPSKCCLDTKNWRQQRSIPTSPPRPCARSSVPLEPSPTDRRARLRATLPWRSRISSAPTGRLGENASAGT